VLKNNQRLLFTFSCLICFCLLFIFPDKPNTGVSILLGHTDTWRWDHTKLSQNIRCLLPSVVVPHSTRMKTSSALLQNPTHLHNILTLWRILLYISPGQSKKSCFVTHHYPSIAPSHCITCLLQQYFITMYTQTQFSIYNIALSLPLYYLSLSLSLTHTHTHICISITYFKCAENS
jgi:hypothetical protein